MCVGELEIGQSSSQRDKQTSGSNGGRDAGTVCSIEIQVIIHLYALCITFRYDIEMYLTQYILYIYHMYI